MERPKSFPARIHALLAREVALGVVFRRGPSKQVCTFLWDRQTDRFTPGQWLKGRIYERRADLSPDGKFLIYFAMNGRWRSRTGGSWTAISRAPWLKAVTLYAKGDCWEGAGLFLSDRHHWLNDRHFSPGRILVDSDEVKRDDSYAPAHAYGAEDTGVYYPRLERDGWRLREHKQGSRLDAVTFFEKPFAGHRVLRKIAHEQVGSPVGKGCYWDEHELIDATRTLSLPEWEWADIDGARLVWAQNGCLFSAPVTSADPLTDRTLLHDSNDYRFTSIEAPY
jgi:hypothetical protein